MKFVDLLGLPLKSDVLLRILAHHDMNIIYNVDTLLEGEPDSYSSSAPAAGFEFRFDERQILRTVFCYVVAADGFQRVNQELVGVPFYSTFEIARREIASSGAEFETGENVHSMNREVNWVKAGLKNYWRHYEFTSTGLNLVTLMLRQPSTQD